MRNKKLMEKVFELDTQILGTREQSLKVMVQSAMIKQAFGVKNDERTKPIKDYERDVVLSDDEIREQFNKQVELLNIAKERGNLRILKELKSQIYYFVDAVRFFNANLSDEFEKVVIEKVENEIQ